MNPVVGFRVWQAHEGLLYPAGNTVNRYNGPLTRAWRREEVAECQPVGRGLPCGSAPNEACTCGLHGMPRPQDAEFRSQDKRWVEIERRANASWPRPFVLGAIVAWGRVVLHRKGFRAERARPIALLRRDPHTDALAQHYRVPLVDTPDELVAVATEYGDLWTPGMVAA